MIASVRAVSNGALASNGRSRWGCRICFANGLGVDGVVRLAKHSV